LTIHLAPGETANNCREAIAALAKDTAARPLSGIYARDRALFRALRIADLCGDRSKTDGISRPPEALVLAPVELPWLLTRLADVASFVKFDARVKQPVIANPPQRLAAAVLAAAPWPGLPVLHGVVQAPTLRADGSVLEAPGYDEESRLLFDAGGETFATVPREPTQAEVMSAKALIEQALVTFPFVDGAARSVAFAAILTALLRRSLPTAPGFLIDAPVAGSGKTLLAHIPAWVAAGTGPHLRIAAENQSDENKSLFSVVLENPSVLVIDKVERPLKSEMLCAMLTGQTLSERILGLSKSVSVPTNITLLITGNNVTVRGDLRRRLLTCRIKPGVEHPERRRFTGPPLKEWIIEHRAELAVALLTLVRAYLAASEPRPEGAAEFGSFEAWSRLVRYPLTHAGYADPCGTLAAVQKSDPDTRTLCALLRAWRDTFGDRAATAKAAVETAGGAATGRVTGGTALSEALTPFTGKDGRVNTRQLGNYLSAQRERIEGGLFIEEAGSRQGVVLWRVVEAEE
jgi:hypothetical protein